MNKINNKYQITPTNQKGPMGCLNIPYMLS